VACATEQRGVVAGKVRRRIVIRARPCPAAEKLPLVGVACGIIHDMYRAVKKAKDNRKSCEQFGETLRGLEAGIDGLMDMRGFECVS
jgi:hypothetical protein